MITAEKEKLFSDYTNLANSLAAKYKATGMVEDLKQEAKLALWQAIDKWDPEKSKFSTYAHCVMSNAIKDALQRNNYFRLPQKYITQYNLILRKQKEFLQENCREANIEELSQLTGLTQERIQLLKRTEFTKLSLDAPQTEDDDSLYDSVEGSINDPVEDVERKDLYVHINQALNFLNKNQRMVIEYLYFDNYTQKQAAEILGISQPRVHQIEADALNIIKKHLN